MTSTNGKISATAVSTETIHQLQESVKNALEEVMGDSSPEMLNEMSTIFLEDAVPLIDQIKSGYTSQDTTAIIIAAHTLKGSSATIGLQHFAEVCLSIETSGKQNEINAVGSLIPRLETKYAEVQAALSAFLL